MEDDDMLADRLNHESVIFRGYSDSELSVAIKVAGVICFPTGLVVGFLFGNVAIDLGGALIVVIGEDPVGTTAPTGRADSALQSQTARPGAPARPSRRRRLRLEGSFGRSLDDRLRLEWVPDLLASSRTVGMEMI
jgi:hypothetical protein